MLKLFFQFFKFCCVGVSNTAVSYGTWYVFYKFFGVNLYVSNVIAFIISVLNAFYWSNRFVFKKGSDEKRNLFIALIKTYASYAGTGLVLANIFLYLLKNKFGILPEIAQIIIVFINIPINFLANKFFAFSTKKKPPIIFLKPVLKETVWGGNRIAEFGVKLPSEHVGESWVISAHKNGDNMILNEEFSGMTLSELFKVRKDLFGNIPNENFPLLTKIIDAKEDLSIQVHPDDDYAAKNENGSLGKTESWYVLDAKPDSKIVIGHNAKTPEEVKTMIENKKWSDFIREIPVHRGDSFFIEPGTVHAIKGGTLILETQQSSDVTYRVYDYDRLSDGKLRQLHIKQSIDVIKSPYLNEEPPKNLNKSVNKGLNQLVSCKFFTVWHTKIEKTLKVIQDQPFMLCSVVNGEGMIDKKAIKKGDNFIIPAMYGDVFFEGNMEIIMSCM